MIKKKVLITGGAGFVGSHLCERLLKKGYFVYCLDNLVTGKHENINHLIKQPNFELIQKNINDDIDSKHDTSGDVKIKSKIFNKELRVLKEFKTVTFDKTSSNNNLLIQIFEKDKNVLKKLDIIDAGTFINRDDPNRRFEKQVFYAGKIYLDDFNTPTFINLFTLIFD